jgi:hypothetical protein
MALMVSRRAACALGGRLPARRLVIAQSFVPQAAGTDVRRFGLYATHREGQALDVFASADIGNAQSRRRGRSSPPIVPARNELARWPAGHG